VIGGGSNYANFFEHDRDRFAPRYNIPYNARLISIIAVTAHRYCVSGVLLPNTGNFIDSGLGGPSEAAKKGMKSVSYGPIPYASNREFFAALQGIKSGDQGSFRRDQGIPPSSAIWRSLLVTNPIIGAVGRVARARVQRAHRRWGIEGSNRLPPAARPLRT
jgi:hypothetical protein